MLRKNKKVYLIVLLVFMVILAACSSSSSPSSPSPSSSPQTPDERFDRFGDDDQEEPFTITMMNKAILAEPTSPDDPIIVALEELTNTKLDIQWVPSSTYNEKLNATIASGQLPMVVLAHPKQPMVINAMKAGQFWELGPYLDDYPNLAKAMNPEVTKSLMVDGKIYALFRSRPLVRDGMLLPDGLAGKFEFEAPDQFG